MKLHPILFNTEMVKAIMDGRKTQTRRAVKPRPFLDKDGWWQVGKAVWPVSHWRLFYQEGDPLWDCAPCKPGDILWVRETWAHPSEAEVRNGADPDMFIYKADSPLLPAAHDRWHPSIHMPKGAARIFLRVKDVWMERLKDIHEKYEPGPDHPVAKEGLGYTCDFIATWENTIKPADRDKYGWDANPWVWVVEFERCKKPEGWC